MQRPLATLFALLALGGSAGAADLASDMASPEPSIGGGVFDWSGFYVGAEAGIAWADATTTAPGANLPFAPNGGLGGVMAGYDMSFGPILVGLGADIAYNGAEDEIGVAPGVSVTNKVDWLGTAFARLGWSLGDILLYGQGGLAYGHQQLEVDIAGLTTLEAEGWRAGWMLGGGIEYVLARPVTLRIDYAHIDLGSDGLELPVPASVTPNVDYRADIAKLVMSYRF